MSTGEIDGFIWPGDGPQERADYLAALVQQMHGVACRGLVGWVGEREALEKIMAMSVAPCCARVSVLRVKEELIQALAASNNDN